MLKSNSGSIEMSGARVDLLADFATLAYSLMLKKVFPAEALKIMVDMATSSLEGRDCKNEMMKYHEIMMRHHIDEDNSIPSEDADSVENIIKRLIFGKE